MSIVKDASAHHTNEFIRSMHEGGGWPGEADEDLNESCRDLVEAFRQEYGEAWLGHVNLYDDRRVKNGGGRDEQIMWKWDGSIVLNFSCAFVAPRFDAELVRLIRERDIGPWSAAQDVVRIDAITKRLEVIGGKHLVWT